MRRTPILIAALAVALPLATGGCSNVKETLGLTKQSPDEFKVVSRAPLSMPPDYNLRPPTPGAPRPQEGTPRDQAQQAVLGIAPDAIPPIGEGESPTPRSPPASRRCCRAPAPPASIPTSASWWIPRPPKTKPIRRPSPTP